MSLFTQTLYKRISRFRVVTNFLKPNAGVINYNTNNRSNNSTYDETWISRYKYFIYFASGVLGFSILKEYLMPKVNAATPYNLSNKLSGRREKHNFIADVVEATAPSVVYIEIKDTRYVDFFSGRPQTMSNGSGFIIKEDGLIVTNAHVVLNHRASAMVEVRLNNGATYKGTVEDVDTYSDLATIRIAARNLPVMKLGVSKDLRPGEFVVALGSPLALSNSVTAGVVSSTERASNELGIKNKDMVYIQTDATITFGNSGGPLVNLDGEAIGVNSMKVAPGISFAIPIDHVKQFLSKARSANEPAPVHKFRKYMGITMVTLSPDIIQEMVQRGQQIPPDVRNGILVWKVIIGSPAHSGGLQPGDIVTHIDSTPVTSANDVYKMLADTNTRVLKMDVIRYGKKFEVKVTPEEIVLS